MANDTFHACPAGSHWDDTLKKCVKDSGNTDTTTNPGPSTPSAPAVDPVEARKIAMFQSIYSQLWGEPATEAYLKGFKDLNSYEFALNERQKPAWLMTKAYKDTLASRVSLFHSLGL